MKTTDVCSGEKEWGCAEKVGEEAERGREEGVRLREKEKGNETDDSDGKNK